MPPILNDTLQRDIALLKTLSRLKQDGADLNTAICPETGYTYLQTAAREGLLYSANMLVLREKVDVNYTPFGEPPLMLATQNARLPVIELLLNNKADMNQVSYDVILDIPETPLSYAKSNHMVQVVELMRRHGAFCTNAELNKIRQKALEDQRIRTSHRSDGR